MVEDLMLQVIDLHTYYEQSHVLQGVSFGCSENSLVCILGRNGVGKTTALHSIIGLVPPRKGKVIFKKKEINRLKPHQISRMGLALVPQGRRIFPSLSVKENLIMAARSAGKDDAWSLDDIYALFPILAERAKLKGDLLSGGEQQMLTIARGLMTNPDFILMDEPSEGLAPIIVRQLRDTIKQLHKTGFSILLVEQNLSLALAVADYVYIMNKGTIVYESHPEQLKHNQEIIAKYLGVYAST